MHYAQGLGRTNVGPQVGTVNTTGTGCGISLPRWRKVVPERHVAIARRRSFARCSRVNFRVAKDVDSFPIGMRDYVGLMATLREDSIRGDDARHARLSAGCVSRCRRRRVVVLSPSRGCVATLPADHP